MVPVKFVAVTACPTGIAHSHMAAEALERAAAERGHDIRVEIQGAMGAEDALTEAEIAAADAAIVAADVRVDTDRFDGLPLVEASVRTGVNDPSALLDRAETATADPDRPPADVDDHDENTKQGPGGILDWLSDRF